MREGEYKTFSLSSVIKMLPNLEKIVIIFTILNDLH